jgi:hypothetical protein
LERRDMQRLGPVNPGLAGQSGSGR